MLDSEIVTTFNFLETEVMKTKNNPNIRKGIEKPLYADSETSILKSQPE